MIHLNNIVIVGVGGTGLSSIAGILHDIGYQNVIGINDCDNQITKVLSDRGLDIIVGHGKYEVQEQDFVIYADVPAIYEGPEVQQSLAFQQAETKHYHMPMTYNQFLAELSKHFRTMAVTGTNGKSSTTALAITAGVAGSKDFALGIVGAMLPDHGQRNYVIGEGKEGYLREVMEHIFRGTLMRSSIEESVFVLESCEYKEHFLMYDTDVAITTNLTHDHHDYFPTLERYQEGFQKLWKQTKSTIVLPENDSELVSLAEEFGPVLASSSAIDFQYAIGSFWSYNAGLALEARKQIDEHFDEEKAQQALKEFSGLWRRMEYLGMTDTDTKVYSDYGHHPDAFLRLIPEMKRQFPRQKLTVIFEPHQARRLLSLRDDFVETMQGADSVWIYRPYTAREQRDDLQELLKEKLGTVSHDADELGAVFAEAVGGCYVGSETVLEESMSELDADDVVLIMSAGDLDGAMRGFL